MQYSTAKHPQIGSFDEHHRTVQRVRTADRDDFAVWVFTADTLMKIQDSVMHIGHPLCLEWCSYRLVAGHIHDSFGYLAPFAAEAREGRHLPQTTRISR
jgi:hypothetical protein